MTSSFEGSLRGMLRPAVINAAAEMLREPVPRVVKAYDTAVPMVLDGISSSLADPAKRAKIVNFVAANGTVCAVSDVSSLVKPGVTPPAVAAGNQFLEFAFGDRVGPVANELGTLTGVKSSSAYIMLSLAATNAIGLLSQRLQHERITAPRLLRLLENGKSGVASKLDFRKRGEPGAVPAASAKRAAGEGSGIGRALALWALMFLTVGSLTYALYDVFIERTGLFAEGGATPVRSTPSTPVVASVPAVKREAPPAAPVPPAPAAVTPPAMPKAVEPPKVEVAKAPEVKAPEVKAPEVKTPEVRAPAADVKPVAPAEPKAAEPKAVETKAAETKVVVAPPPPPAALPAPAPIPAPPAPVVAVPPVQPASPPAVEPPPRVAVAPQVQLEPAPAPIARAPASPPVAPPAPPAAEPSSPTVEPLRRRQPGTEPAAQPKAAVVAAQPASSPRAAVPGRVEERVEGRLIGYIEDSSPPDRAKWFDFDNLQFKRGSAALAEESREQIELIAQIMKAFPQVGLTVAGYTDNMGEPERNRRLSEERAKAVVSSLVKKGIAAERLTASGQADQRPIADNSTAAGRAKNRRIAVSVKSK